MRQTFAAVIVLLCVGHGLALQLGCTRETPPVATPYGGGDKAVLAVNPQGVDVSTPVSTNAAPQYVQVSNGGKGALKWSVSNPSANWLTVTPTAGTNDQKLTLTFASAPLPAGEHVATFQVTAPDNPAAPVNVRVVLSGPPPPVEECGNKIDDDKDGQVDENPPCVPPPDPSQPRGPQASITCPAGAVIITPTQNPAEVVKAHGPGTSYCLSAGTYAVAAPIVLEAGDTLTGAYGAILDGQGLTSSDTSTAIVSGWNCASCANVTIRNLVIKGRGDGSGIPQNCIGAYGKQSGGWTIDHNEIAGCRWGINQGIYWEGSSPETKVYVAGPTITANRIHHNAWSAATGSNGSGAYGITNTTDAKLVNNEIAYNGNEAKFLGSLRTRIADNSFHHNGRAIWLDGDNLEAVIENNDVDDQVVDGIFYEISATGTIRNNRVRRNGGSGLFISTSRQMEVYGNTFEDNWRDINMFVNCGAISNPGDHYPTAIGFDLKDVHIHDNTVRVGTRADTMAGAWSYGGGCTTEQIARYKDPKAGQNNRYVNNTYAVPNVSAAVWFWDGWRTFAQWQAGGMDTTGTVTQR